MKPSVVSLRSLAFALVAFVVLAAAVLISPGAGLAAACLVPLLGTVADPEITKLLGEAAGEVKALRGEVTEVKSQFGLLKETNDKVEKLTLSVDDFQKQFKQLRSHQLAQRRHLVRTTGQISDDAALHVLAASLCTRLKAGGNLEAKQRDLYEGLVKDIMGAEYKTALSSSDIPLPTEFASEVVELVSAFGAARRYGTVFPLGTGTVKLNKLGTDTTFGLIASSGTVTEKSPTITQVTFTAEKFGGLVRVPSEIEADTAVAFGQFIARYAARQMAYVEDWNFFRGTGGASGVNGTAKGLTATVVDDSKTVAMASGDLAPSDITLAKVRLTRSKVDAAALGMSAYYAHPTMEQLFASFNTAGTNPYQANGLNGATLDGFPIRWVDVMPAYSTTDSASTVFILFGDVSYQYLGVRGGMRFESSAEAAFATDEVLVRALERFTVGKMATGAVAGLVSPAS